MHKLLFSMLLLLGLTSCHESLLELSPIVVNREAPTTAIEVPPLSTRTFLLGGGDYRYRAYVADAAVAQVAVRADTLFVKGIKDGATHATNTSHDLSTRIDIRVAPAALSFNAGEVQLYPTEESRAITLTGGGDIVRLTEDDPEDILTARWNATDQVVELIARYEGDATLTATAQDGTQKSLQVRVRCKGQAQRTGLYTTSSLELRLALNTRLVVRNRQQGVSIYNQTTPHQLDPNTGTALRISPIVAPRLGQTLQLHIERIGSHWPSSMLLTTGTHELRVEELRPDGRVLLRARGYKLLVSYFAE